MLKNEVKKIVASKISDEEKVKKIVDLIVCDYWQYDKAEIKDLAKELSYFMIDCIDYKMKSYSDCIDYLNEYYLADEE